MKKAPEKIERIRLKKIKFHKRLRCGAKHRGKGRGCYLKLGHEGWHKNQEGSWLQKKHKPLMYIQKCEHWYLQHDLRKPLLHCELANGHMGQHASKGIMWPKIPEYIGTAPHCGAVDKRWICTLTAGHIGPHSSPYGRVKHSWPQQKHHSIHCHSVDTVHGWFCDLAPDHSGEHQCGEYRWPHKYQEAAPPPVPKCGDMSTSGDRCELQKGHKGFHQGGVYEWLQVPPPPPQFCGSESGSGVRTCVLPPGHLGSHRAKDHAWNRRETDACAPEENPPPASLKQIDAPASVSQKLVLHLASGDVELGESDARRLRDELNLIFESAPIIPGVWYSVPAAGEPIQCRGTNWLLTVTGDGPGCTVTAKPVVTHHFYADKQPKKQ
jgi:hypothetical protein